MESPGAPVSGSDHSSPDVAGPGRTAHSAPELGRPSAASGASFDGWGSPAGAPLAASSVQQAVERQSSLVRRAEAKADRLRQLFGLPAGEVGGRRAGRFVGGRLSAQGSLGLRWLPQEGH